MVTFEIIALLCGKLFLIYKCLIVYVLFMKNSTLTFWIIILLCNRIYLLNSKHVFLWFSEMR